MTLDRYGCLGNTIKVAGGNYVDLANPTPEMIDLPTIAAALSKICRFGGHVPRYYSVAEHCVLAAAHAFSDGYIGNVLEAILLHDAAEAYVGDVVKPLKVLLPEYADIEQRMENAVAARFGIDFDGCSDVIKRYDRIMLKAEKIAMWPDDSEHWEGWQDIETRRTRIRFWKPRKAEKHFLVAAERMGLTTR